MNENILDKTRKRLEEIRSIALCLVELVNLQDQYIKLLEKKLKGVKTYGITNFKAKKVWNNLA